MTSKGAQLLKGGAVSFTLFAVLMWLALRQDLNVEEIKPVFLLPSVAAYVFVLVVRAAIFFLTAPKNTVFPFPIWLSLTARHQLVFMFAPSGFGDLSFPILAKKMLGLDMLQASRLIAETRLRDICAVLGFGCLGLSATGHFAIFTFAAAMVCLVALYWSDLFASTVITVLQRFWPSGKRRNDTETVFGVTQPSKSVMERFRLMGLTLVLWGSASLGILAGFHAAGYAIGLPESWIMLAGLNVAGAIAISLAGFGVAEAGATGVLVFLGLPLPVAAGIAIIARPLLLISNSLASVLIEIMTRMLGVSQYNK
ncbi:lysylphosphatidylglycerol synthase domain-containing protein [Celeribacter sp. PS-C1]|uniref:lysylphosphatidylglycerol synthase domain-containing protein n=1 Tax=Celeribacter sp. PS-C1 TaxID=2820813 RepID=UPI001C669EEF|nr:lysylphosphatidylglycerol synthase domain-containing protein [Celeribacter sp. PS-C1]MBW6419291.1 flippase-like domain-containing protein [Celeribacter sp. PS-C1]